MFHCFNALTHGFNHDLNRFSFWHNKSLGNSDDIAYQIARRNDDYSLGIPRGNLELKHMPIICSYHNKHLIWSQFVSIGCDDKLLNEIGLEIGFSEHYDLSFTPYWQILVQS